MHPTPPYRQIRAHYDDTTVRVYQAYGHAIADPAVAAGRFVPPFSLGRMSWIKPSFLWMMYRCGWATKDPGQARVFAIDLHRSGFDALLAGAVLAKQQDGEHPTIVQWDPERDLHGRALDHRSLQLGLRGTALRDYATTFVARLTDITDEVCALDALRQRDEAAACAQLPDEQAYPVSDAVRAALAMDDPQRA